MCSTDEDVRISQSPDYVLEGDTLNISCAVSYSGLLAPGFTWRDLDAADNVLPLVNTSSSVSSTLQVRVPPFPDSVPEHDCIVTFDGSVGLPRVSAT